MTSPIPALSVRQPWGHAIVHLGKDIENRSRPYGHRGPLLIHASAGMTADEYHDAITFIGSAVLARKPRGVGPHNMPIPKFNDLERGGIIGIVNVVDCVSASDSPWWMGPSGLVLENPRPLPFTPCRGTIAPLFWFPDPDVWARLEPHIASRD